MHILKAVNKSKRLSKIYECPHYSVLEQDEFVRLEFPQPSPDGTWPLEIITVSPDEEHWDAVYHMSAISGDTLDSWSVKGSQVRKVDHRNA